MSFGLIKNLTNEVDQMLHLIGVPDFLAHNDDSCVNDVRGGDDVDQYGFIWSRRRHDQRLR